MTRHDDEAMQELQDCFERDDPRIARHRAITELRSIMRTRIRNGDPAYEACLAYEDGRSAYEHLLEATNESSWDAEKLDAWRHRDFIPVPRTKKRLEPYIMRQETENAIAEYLAGRVRTDQFDRMFLDAGIAAEMFAYMDEPIARAGTFSSWGYLSNLALSGFLLWIADGAWWAIAIAFLFVTGPIWAPLIDKRAKTTRRILQSMAAAYRTLGGPVSSVREIRRELEAARDAGVVWPTPLWVLLEDIEMRRTAV